jgi:hypothetical protein
MLTIEALRTFEGFFDGGGAELGDFDDIGSPEDIENPEEELRKINRVITQYSLVLRTTLDISQQERAKQKLKNLRAYKKKLLQVYDLKNDKVESLAAVKSDAKQSRRYLGEIIRQGIEKSITDPEMNKLNLYLGFFDQEFLMIFSERKMRLDFQHSLERDSYYHRFQEILRKMRDFQDELEQVEEKDARAEDKVEKKKRILRMKRALTIEANRLFGSVVRFAGELVDDIEKEGLKCLNGNDIIHFDDIEGSRHLSGKKLREALEDIGEFGQEVIEFLNIPDFYVQEQ